MLRLFTCKLTCKFLRPIRPLLLFRPLRLFPQISIRQFSVNPPPEDEEEVRNKQELKNIKSGLERLLSEGIKPQAPVVNEYDDVDQIQQPPAEDHDDVERDSDSEEELDAILEIDMILKDFHNEPESASHKRMYRLFKMLSKIDEVLELDSEIITEVIDNVISPQLPYFSEIDQVIEIAQIAFEIKLKNAKFWNSISHTLAVNTQELDIGDIIKLMNILYSHNLNSKIQQHLQTIAKINLLPEEFNEDKLLNYVNDLISGAATVIKDDSFSSSSASDKNKAEGQNIEIVDDYIDTLSQFSKFFKLIDCLHLLQIIVENHSCIEGKADLMKFVIYQVMQNYKNKEFFKGSVITFKEVSQYLEGVRLFNIADDELNDAIEVAEFLLTKAISISDREEIIKKNLISQNDSKSVVKTENQVVETNNSSEVQLIKAKLDVMKHLSSILIDYHELKQPSEKVFALLTFEADYIIQSYMTESVQTDSGYSGEHVKFNQNEIPKDIIKSYIQFQQLLSKSFDFKTFKSKDKKGRINMIKKNYLRLINLVLHNESFQEHADERVYMILIKIQGHKIVDEDVLQNVLKIMKLRIHAYNSLANLD